MSCSKLRQAYSTIIISSHVYKKSIELQGIFLRHVIANYPRNVPHIRRINVAMGGCFRAKAISPYSETLGYLSYLCVSVSFMIDKANGSKESDGVKSTAKEIC